MLKNTPSRSPKWWSSFLLNSFTDPTETTSSSNPFHSSLTYLLILILLISFHPHSSSKLIWTVLMVFFLIGSFYFTFRSHAVSIYDFSSTFFTFSCGVPQGSVLGPLLSTLCTTPLGLVVSTNSLICTMMAPSCTSLFTPTNSALSLESLTTTFHSHRLLWTNFSWMNLNKFLNYSLLALNNVSNFLTFQIYILAMIPS